MSRMNVPPLAWTGTITQLTDNSYSDSNPLVNSSTVIWEGYGNLDPLDATNDAEIFIYEANTSSAEQRFPGPLETPFGKVSATHQNLNDGTNEGIACHDIAAFSVQFHPEAAPGPSDASTVFGEFVDVMRGSDAFQV